MNAGLLHSELTDIRVGCSHILPLSYLSALLFCLTSICPKLNPEGGQNLSFFDSCQFLGHIQSNGKLNFLLYLPISTSYGFPSVQNDISKDGKQFWRLFFGFLRRNFTESRYEKVSMF